MQTGPLFLGLYCCLFEVFLILKSPPKPVFKNSAAKSELIVALSNCCEKYFAISLEESVLKK